MRFIDFFSGIGAFHLAFTGAGHICAGFCEIDRHAVRSYKVMHLLTDEEYKAFLNDTEQEMLEKYPHPNKHNSKWKKGLLRIRRQYIDRFDPGSLGIWSADDIKSVDPRKLPEADIYTFGFPCQSFSTAGRRGGFADTRGTLFFEVMRLAQARQPRYLVAENVPGLLSHDNGRTFGTIVAAMGELGYDVEWQAINSKHYVPQNRLRIYIIGHFGRICGREIFPILGGHGEADEQCRKQRIITVGNIKPENCTRFGQRDEVYSADGIMGALGATDNKQPKKVALYRAETRIEDGDGYRCKIAIPIISPDKESVRQNGRRFKEDGEEMFTLMAQGVHGVIVGEGIKIRNNSPGTPCLTANDGDNISLQPGARGVVRKGYSGTVATQPDAVVQNMRIRKLTPLECFRLQGFPDELFSKAAAVNSDSQLYKQAGNSITVPVASEIAKALAGIEDEIFDTD